MSFKLYRHNYRGPKLQTPNLSEILTDTQPFVIASTPYDARHKRHDYVFAELFDTVEPLLGGILFLDHNTNATYFLKRENFLFKPKHDRLQGPWHRDKFGVFANWYETTLTCSELQDQFESCGYSFENR